MLNVLHISDLHFTATARGTMRDASTAAVSAILRLAAKLKSEGTVQQKLCVFITGDLVHSGSDKDDSLHNDFAAVQEEFLAPLLQTLGIGPERVFIVPGNHELDRTAVPSDQRFHLANLKEKRCCEADVHDDLRKKLSNYFKFIEQHGYRSVDTTNPRLAIFELDGQAIACLNGLAGSYSGNGSTDKGELFVLPSEFGGALSQIPQFSAVLLHHPLSWFSDSCEADLKEFFASKRVRLFTGHIHDQGLHWLETVRGEFVLAQAGVSAENGERNEISLAWLPPSPALAIRHYIFDRRSAEIAITPPGETRVAPQSALGFFQKSEAFFDRRTIDKARAAAAEDCKNELQLSFSRKIETYVQPDIILYAEDEFSGRRVSNDALYKEDNHRVISGDELSGKTSFLVYSALKANMEPLGSKEKINVLVDFRNLAAGRSLKDVLIKKLVSYELNRTQSEYVIDQGLIDVWIDNFDANDAATAASTLSFFEEHKNLRWTLTPKGGVQFTPSNTPTGFPKKGVAYFGLGEVTLPTVLKLIKGYEAGKAIEDPRSVVDQVFRSINNLRAPRTMFYVDSLVDMFLNDASVEPLNRYLLIENLLSDRIRQAHKRTLPGLPIDMEMIDTFIGQIAFHMLSEKRQYLSKQSYYSIAAEFLERKGLQRKRFDPDKILQVLKDSFVLREHDGEFCFIMLSVEDYYLAKHMGHDASFRSFIMSAHGLLQFPAVAEYYIAQNPSDRARIDEIFAVLEKFEQEIWPLIEEFDGATIQAIKNARPGTPTLIEEEILNSLAEVEAAREGAVIVSEAPVKMGNTARLIFSAEERGAVFLQLGASILGVTRTLDQTDRVEIFQKLRRLLLICINGVPVVAQLLANGGEVKLRGITVRADYVGALAKQDDRFYIILRSMLYNIFKRFGTWSGSPSFYNAAVRLRGEETDELIRAALLAQNIEADLAEAIEFIPQIRHELDSPILKEIAIRLFVGAMSLVPLNQAEERRAIDRLADETIELKPQSGAKSGQMLEQHRTRVRQDFADRIGLSAYVGKLLKPRN